MEKKELRDRLVQLCVKAYMFGSEQVIVDLPSLIDFVEQELDKAREEGRREYFSMGMEYFSLIDDSNIYQQKGWKLPEEKAERLQILDKMFNLLKDNKQYGEDKME